LFLNSYYYEFIKKLIEDAIIEIKTINKPDWFYCVYIKNFKLFVKQNETGKYTIMLPEDY